LSAPGQISISQKDQYEEEELMAWQIEIDEEKCTGDEECVNVCPAGVLEMKDGKADPANLDECLGCESCVEVCPSAAISVTEI
jgi:NAD-dependent dihydropyrimidine dehydrogenase PreA subunit